MLPDHTCDRHRSHETHDDDALAFHDLPLRAQRTQRVTNKEFISATQRSLRLNVLTTTAGLPATTTFGSTDLVTTAPAATTEFSPMVTPFRITAFMPIQTLSAILTGAVFSLGRAGRFLK